MFTKIMIQPNLSIFWKRRYHFINTPVNRIITWNSFFKFNHLTTVLINMYLFSITFVNFIESSCLIILSNYEVICFKLWVLLICGKLFLIHFMDNNIFENGNCQKSCQSLFKKLVFILVYLKRLTWSSSWLFK
jgi:hypothetical protein